MARKGISRKPVHLFWTGGWDSTFRLLQLLLEHRVPVDPIYIIDRGRASFPLELGTMERLRAMLLRDHPGLRRLLRPLRVFERDSIRPDPEMTRNYWELRREVFQGEQFEWLTRFCRQEGIRDVEMAVQRDGISEVLIRPLVRRCRKGTYWTYRIASRAVGPVAEVFRWFEFPILDLNKTDMREYVRKAGWEKYMDRTWFCHHPVRDGEPCGRCNPCHYATIQGMAYRIAFHRRWIGRVVRPLKAFLRPLVRAIRRK